MASVPIFNTGANTGIYLDNSQTNNAASKLTSDIVGMEKLKTNKAIQDNEKFLEMMAVDPVTLISQGATKLQAEKFQEFNDTWAKEMQRHKGNLPPEKWIEMRQHRIALEGWQNRLASNQQRYLQELQMYRSNPTKYDDNAFTQATAELYSTGEYETGLQPRGGRLFKAMDDDLTSYWRTKPPTGFVEAKGKDGQIVKTSATGNVTVGRQRLLNLILSDEGYVKDLVQDFWGNSTDEEKVKYLDSSGDGVVTDEEASLAHNFGNTVADIAKNPIMQWGLDKYSARYRRTDDTATNPPSSGATFNSGGMNLVIDGKKYNYTPPLPMEESYQLSNKRSSTEYYPISLPYVKKFDLPLGSVRVIKGVEVAAQKGESVKAAVIGYDAQNNLVRLQPESSDGSMKTTESIIVPLSALKSQLFDIPINKGGKVMNIGEGVSVSGSSDAGVDLTNIFGK